MEYQKVTVVLQPFVQEAADIMMAMLGDMGFESFVETDNGFEGYIPVPLYQPGMLNGVELPFEGVAFTFTDELIPDQNWNKVWEENYFKPIVIGEECLVRSPFHEGVPGVKYEILIEPKMSFGTGHHETTSLMVEFILKLDVAGKRVLDMGCGTGILGILAAMRGAQSVKGIDIDQWCYENTLENIDKNNIANMTVAVGDASALGDEHYDVILANINRNILLNDMHHYTEVLNPGGVLIMSGFYSEDLPMIDEMAKKLNLSKITSKINNNWVAVAYRC